MKTYQSFAKAILTLLGADTAIRIRVDGYMGSFADLAKTVR